jgi:hypothetical protein
VITAEDAVRYFACGAGCKGKVIYCNYSTPPAPAQGNAVSRSAAQQNHGQEQTGLLCGEPRTPSRYELFAVPVRDACKARHVVVSYYGVTEVE